MKTIEEVIQEELGISDEVLKLTDRFYDDMVSALKSPDKTEKTDTMTISHCSINFSFNDVNIICNIIYRNILSKDYFDFHNIGYITEGSSVMVGKTLFFCTINVYGICGTIAKDKAKETIQHEIEHIYQQVRMGKRFGGDSIYIKCKDDMDSGDIRRRKVGRMVYLTTKSEQEGFVNGLYAYLMDANQPYSKELMKGSETWRNYVFLKEMLDEINDDDRTRTIFNEYFVQYGLTMKRVESEVDNLLHKIGRVIIKVKQDKMKQGWR